MICIATNLVHDLYDGKTLHIIAGSQEFFFFDLYQMRPSGIKSRNEPIDLTNVQEIEWLFAPYSVIKDKNIAKIVKKLSGGEISILKDGNGHYTNRIQIIIKSHDTVNLHGAFLHQIQITDSAGTSFVPFEGIININRKIIKS